jgi:hypothetical protein
MATINRAIHTILVIQNGTDEDLYRIREIARTMLIGDRQNCAL